jgi:asparagine synthase (glutamine-hydrolysing)
LRAKTVLTNLALSPADAYANTLALCRPPQRRRLLHPDVANNLNGQLPEQQIRAGFLRANSSDALAGMLAADTDTLLPDDFLVKVDRASMAHGLEVRPPLLDHELLELMARVPSRFKVRGGETKWLLRRAYRDVLPADILARRKMGFEVPVDAWLRGPLRERLASGLFDATNPVGQLLNLGVLRKMFDQHQHGLGRHGPVLWSALVLARWSEEYLCPAPNLQPVHGR